jgi:vesicle transport through interaction with t-SNAREs protein 1
VLIDLALFIVPGGRHSQVFWNMDTSPTALFDSYEQDFVQFIETIRDRLETTSSEGVENGTSESLRSQVVNFSTSLEQKRSTLGRVERELDEADEMASIPNTIHISCPYSMCFQR